MCITSTFIKSLFMPLLIFSLCHCWKFTHACVMNGRMWIVVTHIRRKLLPLCSMSWTSSDTHILTSSFGSQRLLHLKFLLLVHRNCVTHMLYYVRYLYIHVYPVLHCICNLPSVHWHSWNGIRKGLLVCKKICSNRLISRFLSSTCMEVSGIENIGQCSRLSQLSWLLGAL